MDHFFLTGCAGVGKSTLAQKLLDSTDGQLYLIQIDRMKVWRSRLKPATHGKALDDEPYYTNIRRAATYEALAAASTPSIIEGSQLIVCPELQGMVVAMCYDHNIVIERALRRSIKHAVALQQQQTVAWCAERTAWTRMCLKQFDDDVARMAAHCQRLRIAFCDAEVIESFDDWLFDLKNKA